MKRASGDGGVTVSLGTETKPFLDIMPLWPAEGGVFDPVCWHVILTGEAPVYMADPAGRAAELLTRRFIAGERAEQSIARTERERRTRRRRPGGKEPRRTEWERRKRARGAGTSEASGSPYAFPIKQGAFELLSKARREALAFDAYDVRSTRNVDSVNGDRSASKQLYGGSSFFAFFSALKKET